MPRHDALRDARQVAPGVEQRAVDGVREARAAGEHVQDVGLEEHDARVRVVDEPVEPVHARELRVRGVVEEVEVVLLRVQVHLQPLGGQGSADDVVVVRRRLPVRQQVRGPAADGISGGADHLVAERVGDVDLRLAGDRVHHRQAAGVRARRREPGGIQVAADLGDRGLAAELVDVLAEREELDAAVADRREVLEDLLEAARQLDERAEVSRVRGEVRPAEVAHRRA